LKLDKQWQGKLVELIKQKQWAEHVTDQLKSDADRLNAEIEKIDNNNNQPNE
jgi:hypothetical protein